MAHERLTCLVPTHNRPHFLRRLLRFYREHRPDFSFLVVDSSQPAAAVENVTVIESARPDLKIEYRHFNLDFVGKCAEALEVVQTPLVVCCADDDLLIPQTVRQCAEFLEKEPGFESALGRAVLLNSTLPSWRGTLKVLKGYSIEHDRPLDRCRQIAWQFFSNFYGVHRTASLLDNFRITRANTDANSTPHLPEMLLLHLSVMRGRVKVLPQMYSLWQRHGANASTSKWTAEQPLAEAHYVRFKTALSERLQRLETDPGDADQFIDDWYGQFRETNSNLWKRRSSIGERISRILHSIPERAVDSLWTDRARHCRSVRSSDLIGCESTWQAAVKLICHFPQGIPAEPDLLKRCA